jgi:hypothetical protein
MTEKRVAFPFVLLRFWFRSILWIWFLTGFWIFIMQLIHCSIARNNELVKLALSWIELMPGFAKVALGGIVLESGNVTGFIAMSYQHPMVLTIYMIFVISVPTRLLAGHVQDGTMELILSRSVTKNQVYVCACILTLLGTSALVAVMFTGTVTGINISNFEQEFSLWPFLRGSVFCGLLLAATAGAALLTAVLFRNRGTAVGLALVFFIFNYFINIIAEWWPRAKFLGPVSLFHYANQSKILFDSAWPIRDTCVLSALLIITVISGGIIWNRRDLPL